MYVPKFKVYGDGPVRAVLIHGWFGTKDSYDQMLTAVDPTAYTFAVFDFRGFGEAIEADGPYNIETIALDALSVANKLGWDKFSLVGHSMGGKAALVAASLAPDRIQKLCGIAPVWASPAPFDTDALNFFRTAKDNLDARTAIISNTTGDRLSPYWCRAMAEYSARTSKSEAFSSYFESWATEDFERVATAVTTETLVFAGRFDFGVSEDTVKATWLTTLPNAKLKMLEQASHYPMDECPVLLATELCAFLSE